MGCSWWSFATPSPYTDELTAVSDNPAVLLIPKYAVEWANGQTQLVIDHAGDYADLCMKESNPDDDWLDTLDGLMLIGVFATLYERSILQDKLKSLDGKNEETINLQEHIANIDKKLPKFDDCFYSNIFYTQGFPRNNKQMEDLRRRGVLEDSKVFYNRETFFDNLCRFGIKIIPADQADGVTYESVRGFSYCGQF